MGSRSCTLVNSEVKQYNFTFQFTQFMSVAFHITKSDIDDTSFRNRFFRQLQNFLLRCTGIFHSLNHNIIKVFRAYGMRIIVIQAGCYSSKTLDIFFTVQRIENKIVIQLLE